MAAAELQDLLIRMAEDQALPRLRYHFGQHRDEFPIGTEEEYHRLFRQHIGRQDLRYFTFLTPRREKAMWYLVAMGSGTVAQDNESRRGYWSFFRPRGFARFLEHGRNWWVEVRRSQDGLEVTDTWIL